jgi:nitroreductase
MTRRFAPSPLDTSVLDELLDLARRAPSAGYSQGTHLLVLSGVPVEEFWTVTGAREWFAESQPGVLDAPHVVLPLADSQAYTSRYAEADKAGHGLEDAANWPVPYWLTDTAMAAQNLLLLAEERGLAALLFGIFRNERELLDSLGVPAHISAIGAVALGYRAIDDVPSGSSRTRPRRAAAEVVHHQHW